MELARVHPYMLSNDPSTFVAYSFGGGSLNLNGYQKTGRNKNGNIRMGVMLLTRFSIGVGWYHHSDSFVPKTVLS